MAQYKRFASDQSRIAKVIARSGLCSRRNAEQWILDGRVQVNGKRLESPAFNVTSKDTIKVDGKPLPEPSATRLFRYHKPKGRVTSHNDPQNRPTVFEALPPELPRLISVGRLDLNTEGLLLLTTDGGVARHLELPSTGWLRKYRVRAKGAISQSTLDQLKNGIEIDGVRYGEITAKLDRTQAANCWMTLSLREGKNREIRRVLSHLGLQVNRLIRISYGPFVLGDLKPGQIAEIKLHVLADQLGPKVAAELGVSKKAKPKKKK